MTSQDLESELTKLIESAYPILIAEMKVAKAAASVGKRTINIDIKGISSASRYQQFFLISFRLIKALCPERLEEFNRLYLPDPHRKAISSSNFAISDYFRRNSWYNSTTSDSFNAFAGNVNFQVDILKGIRLSLNQKLLEIQRVLEANLYDNELSGSKALLKAGFLRASGVIAGVVLEAHLKATCTSRNFLFTKKNPTLSDFYERLKSEEAIDLPEWRRIQRLGDIRNLCARKSDRDPTTQEVDDLISGTAQVLSTIF